MLYTVETRTNSFNELGEIGFGNSLLYDGSKSKRIYEYISSYFRFHLTNYMFLVSRNIPRTKY